jgi:hypothetical protein
VNPNIAKYSKVAEIIADQLSIVANFKSLIQRMNASGRMTGPEINYIGQVYDHISEECVKSLNGLIAVTTDNQLEMSDDERIKRIDGIYSDMKDKYTFTLHFTSLADKIGSIRSQGMTDNEFLKALQ